jgi:hypothetical protein
MTSHRLAAAAVLVTCVVWGGLMLWALDRAAVESGVRLVIFGPGTDSETAFRALVGTGGTPIGRAWLDTVWQVDMDGPDAVGRLKAAGALWVLPNAPLGQAFAAGCGFGPVTMMPAERH